MIVTPPPNNLSEPYTFEWLQSLPQFESDYHVDNTVWRLNAKFRDKQQFFLVYADNDWLVYEETGLPINRFSIPAPVTKQDVLDLLRIFCDDNE